MWISTITSYVHTLRLWVYTYPQITVHPIFILLSTPLLRQSASCIHRKIHTKFCGLDVNAVYTMSQQAKGYVQYIQKKTQEFRYLVSLISQVCKCGYYLSIEVAAIMKRINIKICIYMHLPYSRYILLTSTCQAPLHPTITEYTYTFYEPP